MTTERLQKILAHAGHGSRRACEDMIEHGRVAVDGRVAQLGDKADPMRQRITVDGVPIRALKAYTYVVLYKPRGVISTTSDPQGRRTVLDLVPLAQRLYPVGRLDADSEGLLLLTDDGELTDRLTHPRYGHSRVYRVLVVGEPTAETLDRWQRGITLDGKKASFSHIEVEERDYEQSWLRVTVYEGRKHLVRRMVAALGHLALRLVRVEMGPIRLGSLKPGQWRYLSEGEIKMLQRKTDIPSAPERNTSRRTAVRRTMTQRNKSQRSTGARDSVRRDSPQRESPQRPGKGDRHEQRPDRSGKSPRPARPTSRRRREDS